MLGNAQARQSLRRCLFWTYLFGLIAHAYVFFNSALSHDALYQVFSDDNQWQVSLGRFLQPLVRLMRGSINAPWLVGLLGLFFVALSAWMVLSLVRLRGRLACALVCGVFSTNLCLSLLNASFTPWVDVFMLSLFLAVAAAYLFARARRRWLGVLLGGVCLAASLGLYQSYVSVAAGLMMILFVDFALENRRVGELVAFAGRALATLVLGAALYWLGVQAALRLWGTALTGFYNDISGVGDFSGVSVPALIVYTYRYFLLSFLRPGGSIPAAVTAANLALAAGGAACFFLLIRLRRVRALNAILALLCLAAMPFALNVSAFLSKGTVHGLMTYAFNLVYVLLLCLMSRFGAEDARAHGALPPDGDPRPAQVPSPVADSRPRLRRIARAAMAACVGVLLFANIVYANGLYLKKELEQESFAMLMTRILDRVEQVEGYVPGRTPVAFLGEFDDAALVLKRAPFAAHYKNAGMSQSVPLTYSPLYPAYFEKVLGYPINLVPYENLPALCKSPQAQNMGVFPAADSVQMVDGCVYVRMAERLD